MGYLTEVNILVTGSNGQLGTCIKDEVANGNSKNIWHFTDRSIVDITDIESIRKFVIDNNIKVIVNCAAYTNVDKAEEDYDTALEINYGGVCKLTSVCREFGIYLIHISTDYVFNGTRHLPYLTSSECKPLGCYGTTKWMGENEALEYEKAIIIRTSWLYSEYGKNFYRTMINRIIDKKETKVVCDQIGSPTYARDLAEFIIFLIEEQDEEDIEAHTGLYHFTNNGCCSWYDFAASIEQLWWSKGRNDFIKPCKTSEYPTKAERPPYSVLDKTDLYEFPYEPRHWLAALRLCMMNDIEIQEH
jgi:dTDP-4-dehydrorhamnose reductase